MHLYSPILLAALFAAPVSAATPPPSEHRLTPAQIQQVLDDAAAQREASDRLIGALPATPDVHGELGVEIGTGGYRSAYGSAVLGIGRRGSAMVSFDSTRFNSRRRDHY